MDRRKMIGTTAQTTEIQRQVNPDCESIRPKPIKLVTKIPKTVSSWKKLPSVPRIDGIDISPM